VTLKQTYLSALPLDGKASGTDEVTPIVLSWDESRTTKAGQTDSVSGIRMCNCISALLSITYLKQQIL
jgi:hypothetical protein